MPTDLLYFILLFSNYLACNDFVPFHQWVKESSQGLMYCERIARMTHTMQGIPTITHYPPHCIKLHAVFEDAVAARDVTFASMIPRVDVVGRASFDDGRYAVCGAVDVGVTQSAVVSYSALNCGLMMRPKFQVSTHDDPCPIKTGIHPRIKKTPA